MKKFTFRLGLILVLGFIGLPLIAAQDNKEKELTLEQVRKLVQKKNFTLLQAKEQLYQAGLLIDTAWSGIQPYILAQGKYDHYNTEAMMPDFESMVIQEDPLHPDPNVCEGKLFCFTDMTVTQKQDSLNALISLRQPVFSAETFASIKNAYQSFDVQKSIFENTEDFMVYNAEKAYFTALTMQKLVDSAKDSVKIKYEHWQDTKTKFDLGQSQINKLNVLQSAVDVNTAKQELIKAENNFILSKEAIGILIGSSPDFILVQPEFATRPRENVNYFIERARKSRRDIIEARLGLTIKEKNKQIKSFAFIPTLDFGATFQATNTERNDSYTSWLIGFTLNVPIYESGLRRVDIDKARSAISEAQLKVEEKILNVTSEIRQIFLIMENTEANLKTARQGLALADEGAKLAKLMFEAGTITNLEVLDANFALYNAEISVATQELALQLAIMTLDRAVKMYDPSGNLARGLQS